MQDLIHEWCHDQSGAAAFEYAMLIVVISLVVISSASLVANDISSIFTGLGSTLLGAFGNF